MSLSVFARNVIAFSCKYSLIHLIWFDWHTLMASTIHVWVDGIGAHGVLIRRHLPHSCVAMVFSNRFVHSLQWIRPLWVCASAGFYRKNWKIPFASSVWRWCRANAFCYPATYRTYPEFGRFSALNWFVTFCPSCSSGYGVEILAEGHQRDKWMCKALG